MARILNVLPSRRRRLEQGLDRELQYHIDRRVDDLRQSGLSDTEARRLAAIEFGGVAQVQEDVRDTWVWRWLDEVTRDVSFGLRTLKRRPGFAATAMLSLALGIGANSGIFSLVDQALLRFLPVREPQRLVLVDWKGNPVHNQYGGATNLLSYPLCRELQEQERFFDGVLCRAPATVNVSMGGQYEQVGAEMVSGSYFEVLGVRPELGRLIGDADDLRPGEHPVVVLSYDYWKNRLGSAPDVVGRNVLLNGHPMTVIGVAAAGFRGMDAGDPASLWTPAMMAREATLEFGGILNRRVAWVHAFARLRPGVTAEEAKAGLQPWFTAMLEADLRSDDFPQIVPERRREFLASAIDVLPGAQGWSSLRRSVGHPLSLLMVGSALLLLLACLNVASLLLARGAERTQELTTRMALGASRGRIARQLIVESLMIALAGGLLGLAAAPVVSGVLLRFLPEGTNLAPIVDGRILSFTLAASIVAGLLAGLAPALQARRRPLASSINGRATAADSAVRFRKVMMGAQLALTLVLLAGAGLFVQTLTGLYARDRGFDGGRLVMFRADPAGTGYSATEAPRVMRDLFRRLQEAPGIERVALANNALLGSGGPSRSLTIGPDRIVAKFVPAMRISEGFFSTVGVSLIAGREFNERDTRDVEEIGIRSVIVNESFAKRYFRERSPVGEYLGFGTSPETAMNIEIVGVVSDFSRRFLRDDWAPDHIFTPFAQTGPLAGDGTFYVRTRGEPEAGLAPIRAAAAQVDSRLALRSLTTLDDQITRALRSERMLAALSSGFGAAALLLSVVGLFGVMSFVAAQRTQEIGMRMALGATRSGAMWIVVRDALAIIGMGTAAGIALGITLGVLARPWLEDVLYAVSPSDVATFASTSIALVAVALAACVIPAGRAAMLSPMVAIRDQPESMLNVARQRVRRTMQELSSGSERNVVSPGTLTADIAGAIHRAPSFPDAVAVALATLRERVGAQFVLLLDRSPAGEYRGPDFAIPADGVLIKRLMRYPYPLPITAGDLQAWGEWSREFRPGHVAEIELLARTDPRMAVPLRTSHELAGVLLLGPPGEREEFTAAEKQLLSGAADVFALLIENVRLNGRALEQEKLRRDLALAGEVQRRLLPAHAPRCDGATFAAFTLPARTVGGDYYDFVDAGGGRIGVAVADVAGKGIAAALLMSAVQASLRLIAAEREVSCSQLAADMNRALHRSTATNGYVTFFYAWIELQSHRLRYVNAGHNPPYLVRRIESGVEITSLGAGGTVLGLFPDVAYEEGDVELRPGDRLVAFTDGVTDARNPDGEEFGDERLKDFLQGAVAASAEEISSSLADRLREWTAGAEQHDDVTFVVGAMK